MLTEAACWAHARRKIHDVYISSQSATAEEVVEKLRCGIHVNLRASSLIDNLKTLVAGCRNHQWKDMVSICTDDVHAKDLLTVGHINKVVRKAVQAGISGCKAIKLATFNVARSTALTTWVR